MTTEIQWKCKTYHPGCQGVDFKLYKEMSESDAKIFMEQMAKNSKCFDYRVKPKKEEKKP